MSHRTKIIITTGRAQSGKDTACDMLKIKCKGLNKSVKKYSFATPLKEFAIRVLGLTEKQCWGTNEDKNTLTKLKWKDLPLTNQTLRNCLNDANIKYSNNGRDFVPDEWTIESKYMTARQVLQVFGTNICRKWYPDCWADATKRDILADNKDVALIADARFPNELEVFRDLDPVVIRFTRNVTNGSHESETALDNFDFESFPRFYRLDNTNMSLEEKSMALFKLIGHELK